MALLNPTFLLGICVLLYLSSFVVFAILRIVTGISIQRIGYLSLRRLAYTPRDGIRIDLRGLGINLHRPTFAQPTWLSIVLTELAISVDLNALENDGDHVRDSEGMANGRHDSTKPEKSTTTRTPRRKSNVTRQRSKSWETLNKVKERIKRLHRKINWLRMVDVVASSSSLTVVGVGDLQVGNFTMAVDTRRKMVDRGRMFQHKKLNKNGQRPAEWMLTIRSVLFTPQGKDSLEVLDHATLNVHGLLYDKLDGLRDAAIALKLGRVHIPYDDLHACLLRYNASRQPRANPNTRSDEEDISVEQIMQELDHPGNREDKLTQTVNDSKEFASSILRGIKEVQFAVSYVGFTTQVSSAQPSSSPVYINASMKEIGVEVHRLDPKSPAHRMYFSPKDIAHQALVAALSVEVGVDNGQGKNERILYIPMSTTTIRTTLPSKTVETVEDRSADERNANIMFANIVITSLSIDLDPKHLPIILALLRQKQKASKNTMPRRQVLISRLLPKANVKFSMHEPVVRIALPPVEDTADPEDFDLIISSISSVALDVESSHSEAGDLHYSLCSTLRVQSHNLYYQSSSAKRHDLLQTESMDLKVQVSATPEVYVVASGNLQTCSVHLNRPEISDGVRQIMNQLRLKVEPETKFRVNTSTNPNFIRALPPWLLHFQFQASDFSAEVAGIDEDISENTRGVALQLASWTAEYRAQRMEAVERTHSRRRTSSRSLTPDASFLKNLPHSPRKRQANPTDGRRLSIHVRGLEGFVIESKDEWEAEPTLAIPRFEIALSTSSDAQGPIFHFNSHVKTLLVQYSLYRHYALGVAIMVLRTAFVQPKVEAKPTHNRFSRQDSLSPISAVSEWDRSEDAVTTAKELLTVDVRATLVQIKAEMPSDPPLMLQIYGMEAGRHRWSPPFLHTKLARLYVAAPKMKRVWARIASIKTAQINLREGRKRMSTGQLQEENVIDINTEAVRLAVPHQVVLHKTFDNIVTTLKATEQLHHRFKTGTNEYILEKGPEGPKNVPKVLLRSRALLFELEDGAFEWKLGAIYRAGQIEQQQRLAREQAFRVKMKKLEAEKLRDPARFRARSAHPRGRSKQKDEARERSKSNLDRSDSRKRNLSPARGRRMRYDPEGTCGLSNSAKISAQDAWAKLQNHNAQSWKKRIDRVYEFSANGMKEIRGVFWGPDQLPDDMEETENILEVPHRPALMATLISDLHITIGKPSFPMDKLADFLHSVGKGIPRDMQYTLLMPMHVQINMGEARVTLRDYPLPLLHVPAIKVGQSARTPAWSLKTDFVIAEEFRGRESSRYVKVNIVPPGKGNFAIDVRRTVSPVKSYSDINMDINTSIPTRITWGASYQPAIQDMMMVIETFTKPQLDPSDRTGFWDKIRLSFHSRVSVAWKGDGAVHLMLKGTKDPYVVTGNGAGFLMCWRNEVRWNIARDEDPRKFMTVDSGEYVLAIPDYSYQARQTDSSGRDDASISTTDSYKNGAIFKKVIMKLSGNVQWLAGLMFERSIGNGKRSFDFEPHYNVVLKGPDFVKAPPGQQYDAFRGFRSHHIHMSIAVKAPVEREWSVTNTKSSDSYNTVHLTPRFFSHFFAWWSMFGGTMSLPIRQGALWPGIDKSSKKFGRHLATIKYNLLLAPLFISHIYKHKEIEDYAEDVVSATGVKLRLDSFMLDMHQRREEFATQEKGRKTQGKTSGMKIHRAQLDLLSADVRAISASIAGTTAVDLKKAAAPNIANQQDTNIPDLSSFNIPDNDFSWIDMDDFVELDGILPSEANPDIQIMPLAFAPRFTFFRQTDRGDTISGDPDRTSPFGNEPTHFCIISQDDDPRRVQCQLISDRLKELERQMAEHSRNLGAAELRRIQGNGRDETVLREVEQLEQYLQVLRGKKLFLESMYHRMAMRMHTNNRRAVPDGDADVDSDGETTSPKDYDAQTEGIDSNPAGDFISDFNNRFVIHNMQMKWNNTLRNIILRYIHQVSQRRGFVYYLSRRAVKFILDIVEEQSKSKSASRGNTLNDPPSASKQSQTTSNSPSSYAPDETYAAAQIQELINGILSDGKKFVSADDPNLRESPLEMSAENLTSNIAQEFTPQNSYHLRLIAPQIQLQSEKNAKSVVLVTAKGMELKVVEVMDKDRISDSVSGLVQRRFSVEMDSTQFFVTQQKWFSSQLLTLYSGNHYGTPAGSAWPPWVPMEVMFDFKVDPFGFKRVVQKTSASLRYDKYNTLRLKYNDEITSDVNDTSSPENVESRMDHLWVEFPQVRAICDSSQYYAMYIIVLDLLLYNEPLEKTRSERLEKIMLASDFSDLRGAPEMVIRLQERIRQLEDLKTLFMVHSKSLDKQGWEDRLLLEQDLASCEDELFFMMKAITTSQRKYDGTQTSGLLKWNISSEQIVWHLMRDDKQPLMEFQLKNAEYNRTDNTDGSHINTMEISRIVGLNLLPDAIYPEMIAPYLDDSRGNFDDGTNPQMFRVYWYMLEAIAGIPVMDHFEVNLFPMKIQLEREVGKKLFEYIFPGTKDKETPNNASPFLVKHMQPVQDEDETEGGNNLRITTSSRRLSVADAERADSNSSTRAGSLELRLRPTLTSEHRPHTAHTYRAKPTSVHSAQGSEGHRFGLFQSNKRSKSNTRPPSIRTLNKKASYDSLSSLQTTGMPRPGVVRTGTGLIRDTSAENKKRFGFPKDKNGKRDSEQNKNSDDLTKMMSRASNYMTLAYVKIPSVVLCLSYKGKGERNLEDVHDFVFRLPMLEYRNKTWSNLDLALALKRDVIKALISHTGAIIGNKFSKSRPSNAQQTRLRELATSSMLLAPESLESSRDNSDDNGSSIFNTSPTDTRFSEHSKSPSRSTSRHGNGLTRSPSGEGSSINSYQSYRRSQSFPMNMMMTSSNAASTAEISTIPISRESRADSVAESESFDAGPAPSDSEGRHGSLLGRLGYLGRREKRDEESDEGIRKKSKLLLGKRLGKGA